MKPKRTTTPLGKVVLLGIFTGIVGLVVWLSWNGLIRPWRMTNEFFALAAAGEAAPLRARFAPDRRDKISDENIRTWSEGLRGYESWEFARKASSLGTTRGGRSVASTRGYVHYPGSKEERSFSLSLIEMDGSWYFDSFMLGHRSAPR